MTVPAGNQARQNKTYTHEGQEFQYVLQGRIELSLGKEKIRLSTGDAAYWESTVPHAVRGLGRGPNRTLHVHLVPGRRSGAYQERLEREALELDKGR
jgi:quercetin dioxygenase-like cupin family protein